MARARVLWLSTIAFTLLFNVWLMLGVLGLPLRDELGLSDAQLEALMAMALLAGALPRLHFGTWAEQYGGRAVLSALLLGCALPAFLFSHATSFPALIALAFGFGLAGNAFTAGISWNAAWFPPQRQGMALGIFGAGNVGAAGTKILIALFPAVLVMVPASGWLGGIIPGGWRAIPAFYAVLLVVMALAVLALAPRPDLRPGRGRPFRSMIAPLRHPGVWRLGLEYVVVFGAYVALSAWLPKYYRDTYGLSLPTAALLAATYILPASLLRPLGGWLSDRVGARVVSQWALIAMIAALTVLAIPNGTYVLDGPGGGSLAWRPGPIPFALLMGIVGVAMGIGKGSSYKAVADEFPRDIGAVGGLVGMLGALGGFLLPLLFGLAGRKLGVPQAAFLVPLALALASLAWLRATQDSAVPVAAESSSPAPAPLAP